MKIKWIKNKDDDGTHDLCGKFNGKYCDVVQRWNNSWSVYFNNIRIEEEIKTRKAAKECITKFLENT